MPRRKAASDGLNPISKWEEQVEVEGLTLWDLNRPVWEVKKEDDTGSNSNSLVDAAILHSDIKCPICLGILQETETVMECMHRFCGACIQRCLRGGKQECPSCRQHVPSRRSLRRDTNFDAAISKIFPDLKDHERRANKRIKRSNFANARAVAQKLKEGIEQQNEHRRKFRYVRTSNTGTQRKRSAAKSPDPVEEKPSKTSKKTETQVIPKQLPQSPLSVKKTKSHSLSGRHHRSSNGTAKKRKRKNRVVAPKSSENSRGNHHHGRRGSNHGVRTKDANREHQAYSSQNKDEVRFQLKCDDSAVGELAELEYPWLQTSGNIQVKHLKKYLSRKLNVQKALSILVKVEDISIVLEDDLRYRDVRDANSMRVLYYRSAA